MVARSSCLCLALKAVMSAAFLVFCPISYVYFNALCIAGNLIQLKVWRTKCQIQNSRTRRHERQRFPAVICKLYQLIISNYRYRWQSFISRKYVCPEIREATRVLAYPQSIKSANDDIIVFSFLFKIDSKGGYVPLIWLCRVLSTEDGNCRKNNCYGAPYSQRKKFFSCGKLCVVPSCVRHNAGWVLFCRITVE